MSKLLTTSDFRILSERLKLYNPKYIVLEGYNAVGKSVVLEKLSETFNYRVYRPNYNTWANQIPRDFRWAIFGSFMNISSEMNITPKMPILFDRGFFSGVVYNDDPSLASLYKNIVGKNSHEIIHILIECSKVDYEKFLRVRNSEKSLSYEDYLEYTTRYEEAFDIAGANYIVYENIFDDSKNYEEICLGCSHYTFSDNACHNQLAIDNGIDDVSPYRKRCKYSSMKEVQDSGKLYELSSVSE